jgi:hypothetical protein
MRDNAMTKKAENGSLIERAAKVYDFARAVRPPVVAAAPANVPRRDPEMAARPSLVELVAQNDFASAAPAVAISRNCASAGSLCPIRHPARSSRNSGWSNAS